MLCLAASVRGAEFLINLAQKHHKLLAFVGAQGRNSALRDTPGLRAQAPLDGFAIGSQLQANIATVSLVGLPLDQSCDWLTISTDFIRIVFSGDALSDFVSLGFDDHVKAMADDQNGEPLRREYTPRRFDAVRPHLTIDFAIHGVGKASECARQAVVGQPAVIGGPRGSMIVPADYDWHLFVGDATAAPAMGRRLAELTANAHAIVIAQLGDLEALELAQSAARLELRQVATPGELIAALRAIPMPEGEGYAWTAGEASVMKQVRDVLVVDKSHPREAMRVAAYWKRGELDFHEELGE